VVVAWVVGGLLALLAGRSLLRWLFAPEAPPKLANQVWVERVHRNPRDMVHDLVLVEDKKGRHFGVTGRASRFRANLDLLLWSQQGDRLNLALPQDRVRVALQYRTWNCKGQAPAPFELCLELRQDRRRVRLYSREQWVVRPGQQLEVEGDVASAVPGLPTLLQQLTSATNDQAAADEAETAAAEPTESAADHAARSAQEDWPPPWEAAD
jgi:hypothetical protein